MTYPALFASSKPPLSQGVGSHWGRSGRPRADRTETLMTPVQFKRSDEQLFPGTGTNQTGRALTYPTLPAPEGLGGTGADDEEVGSSQCVVCVL